MNIKFYRTLALENRMYCYILNVQFTLHIPLHIPRKKNPPETRAEMSDAALSLASEAQVALGNKNVAHREHAKSAQLLRCVEDNYRERARVSSFAQKVCAWQLIQMDFIYNLTK